MCGIAGILACSGSTQEIDRQELRRMRERMVPRGPDGQGEWFGENGRVGLAHRRLAVIDLSAAGQQPMTDSDGDHVIVFNGEIYNYLELRSRLEGQGRRFRTHTDTEVLLQLYATKGLDMLRELRGMYAFAIWDVRKNCLVLARDPFGIKPLYIADDGRAFRFASQVKALLAGGAVSREIDMEAETDYWVWGHIPEPRTLYTAIRALPPGSWLRVDRHGRRYSGTFQTVADLLGLPVPTQDGETVPQRPEGPRSNQEPAHDTLRAALVDTVRHHLVADVPVGIFLSSGIDSATLAALAAECGGVLRTVTLGFEEYRGTPADETVLAETVARQYGAHHQTVWITRKDFEQSFETFMDAMDQPSIDGLNIWLVSRVAAGVGLKVALSGVGGDEFFGGYPSFQQLPRMRSLARPFSVIPGLGSMIRKASAPLLRRCTSEKYAGLLEYGATWEGAYLLRRALRMPWQLPDACRQTTAHRDDEHAETAAPAHAIISHLEATRYMRNQLLRDSDWASMAHSIELRVPLVDVEVTRFLAQARCAGHVYTKQDLAVAAMPPLPGSITHRPKTGFTVPVRDWMRPRQGVTNHERGLRGWQFTVLGAYKSTAP